MESLAGELGLALSCLESVLTPENATILFAELGLDAAPNLAGDIGFTQKLENAAQRAGALFPAIETLSNARESNDDLATVQAVGQVLLAIRGLVLALDDLATDFVRATAALPQAADLEAFALTFVDLLLGNAVVNYLELAHPFLRRILSCLAIIEMKPVTVPVDNVPTTVVRKKLHLDRVSRWLTEPGTVFHDVYGWGENGFDGNTFLANVRDVFDVLFPIAVIHKADEDDRSDLDLFGFLVRVAADASPPGLEGQLFANPAEQADLTLGQLTDAFRVALQIDGALAEDLRLRLLPPARLEARAGANLKASAALLLIGESEDPNHSFVILGASSGSRLEAAHVSTGLVADLGYDAATNSTKSDFRFEVKFKGGELVLDASEADGFLASVLPSSGVHAPFDASLTLSSSRGFSFSGSGSLDATFPVGPSTGLQIDIPTHLSLGPVEIQSLTIGAQPKDGAIPVDLGATIKVSLGPFTAIVQNFGLRGNFSFPDSGGNLGPLNLDVGFKSPTGAGLSIDAAVVAGGGFLSFDTAKGEYSGILELEIAEKISVKAIGMLMTKLPGGGKGYSFVAIIFAPGFAPIQLGSGFTLTGIGGLIGINRTFDENALRAGLQSHTLESVMFPADPVRNAPQILSNLNKVFPPATGHHLFGPMLQISWGTPALITANLAVVLEIGARLRLLLLAQVAAILPKKENDLVRLQMDAVGVLYFDEGTASLDASLVDSRLLKKFVLTGDMAMRLRWEGTPNFALSVGGLHPAFNPPPGFPKLERIAINLTSGNNPRIRCESYFALTSNTVQFGARAELYAEAAGFSISGEIGYDVLIQLDPFAFVAEFQAQVQLKRGSTNLFKVRVEGSLAGPRPLHIKGKATFEILWCDVSVRIDKVLVEGEKPPGPTPIEVMPRLKEALGNVGNWTSLLPAVQRNLVTLRTVTAAPGQVLLHPLGGLGVKQKVVPLKVEITRFGQAAPAGVRRFEITNVTLGGKKATTEESREFFAPGEYFEMSDEEKLSRPSFETMTSGVDFTNEEFTFTGDVGDRLEVGGIEFETKIVDREEGETRSDKGEGKTVYRMTVEQLLKQGRYGAAGRSELRKSGKGRYRLGVVKNEMSKEGWSIVSEDDLKVKGVPGNESGKATTYTEAEQVLEELKKKDPTKAVNLKILRLSEISQN